MIQERNIATCVILSIVTCGIYYLYWLVCVVNDLNIASDTPEDTSGAMVLILTIVTCDIYLLYWLYKAGDKLTIAQQKRGMPSDSNNAILYLILGLFGYGFIPICLLQNELNKMAPPSTNA